VNVFGAIDIGASSGRVIAGRLTDEGLQLHEVHRFSNGAVESGGHLRWNLTGLYEQVLIGLRKLAELHPGVVSLGIDTWAVDYGLLDAEGWLLAEPIAYRDDRTEAVIDDVHGRLDRDRLYAISGLQFLPFNTLFQLAAEQRGPNWSRAQQALMLPDLLAYWLTGERRTEVTNASTTGLLDARSRSWSIELLEALNIPPDLFPTLIEPGEAIGRLRPTVAAEVGLPESVQVVAVGSHDTASAVVGVPAADRAYAYVSSGTWSLVGLELDEPVLTAESQQANFTNEGGVDGRIRFLRNEGGLWLLQESLRTWRDQPGDPPDHERLLAAAAELEPGGPIIDVGSSAFIPPGDMPARIRAACGEQGQSLPDSRAALVRCILDSLATAYASTVRDAETLAGQTATVIHIVGGGCQNALLCQLTADLSGKAVLAGPVEATAIGNLLVQARAAGTLSGSLEDLRQTVRDSFRPTRYEPRSEPRSEGEDARG
jgi:rhamnulokinase